MNPQMWCSEGSKVSQTHYRIINSPVSKFTLNSKDNSWGICTCTRSWPWTKYPCSQTGPLRYLLHFNSSKTFKSKQTHHNFFQYIIIPMKKNNQHNLAYEEHMYNMLFALLLRQTHCWNGKVINIRSRRVLIFAN